MTTKVVTERKHNVTTPRVDYDKNLASLVTIKVVTQCTTMSDDKSHHKSEIVCDDLQ